MSNKGAWMIAVAIVFVGKCICYGARATAFKEGYGMPEVPRFKEPEE